MNSFASNKNVILMNYNNFQKKKWNKNKIIRELKNISNSINRTPREKDFIEMKNYGLYKAAKRHFGNYTKAVEAAKLEPNLKFWSKEKIIKELKKIINELGHVPTYRELVKQKRHDIISAIRRHYKCRYNDVVRGCGFQPNNIRWSKEKIKKELIKLQKKINKTPTERELRIDNCDLFGASIRFFGSLNEAIKQSGLEVNSSFVEDDFWKYWESFVIRSAKSIYDDFISHPRLPNKKIPDAIIKSKNIMIEAKVNISHEYILNDIINYSPFSKQIEFWYLYGKPSIFKKNVKYVGPKEIEKLLRIKNKVNLIKELNMLKKGIKCSMFIK
ncbi:MAG: hypothetical protein JW754_06060 [Candidatus Aenigmarchaeota archaeon]|nr:hypothetical protein [Candidatus Aenigmarchaeota archaeon]